MNRADCGDMFIMEKPVEVNAALRRRLLDGNYIEVNLMPSAGPWTICERPILSCIESRKMQDNSKPAEYTSCQK